MIEANSHLHHVAAYTPGASPEQIRLEYGLDSVVKLASNENPLGSPPAAIVAAREALRLSHGYNDGGMALRQKLAVHHNVGIEAISVHNGSDAIIHQIMRTFLCPGNHALSSHGTFVSFDLAVRSVGSRARFVPLTSDYRFNVRALASSVDSSTKVIYIANPNNPTGTYITHDELVWLLDSIPSSVLVVLDEAYYEYAFHVAGSSYPNALSLNSPNLLCLRTFSKAYGLAALRTGYAVGDPSVVQWLIRTKLPFDPNGPGCAAAMAALDDIDFVRESVKQNTDAVMMLSETLIECGYTISQSAANFVMIDCGTTEKASELYKKLLFAGFITRPLKGFGLPSCVRISTGTHEQNLRLAMKLRELAADIVDAPLSTRS